MASPLHAQPVCILLAFSHSMTCRATPWLQMYDTSISWDQKGPPGLQGCFITCSFEFGSSTWCPSDGAHRYRKLRRMLHWKLTKLLKYPIHAPSDSTLCTTGPESYLPESLPILGTSQQRRLVCMQSKRAASTSVAQSYPSLIHRSCCMP